MTQRGGEHSLKISGPWLLRFGKEGVLKILSQRMTESVNELATTVFIEQHGYTRSVKYYVNTTELQFYVIVWLPYRESP